MSERVGQWCALLVALAGVRRGSHDRHAVLHPRQHVPRSGLERQERPASSGSSTSWARARAGSTSSAGCGRRLRASPPGSDSAATTRDWSPHLERVHKREADGRGEGGDVRGDSPPLERADGDVAQALRVRQDHRPRGKKPGFKQILITQVVSGVWHGLYAGYWLFFVSSAVFLQGSKSMFRWQRAHWPRRWNFLIDFPHWLLTTVGLNYLCGAFMLVTYEQCMAAWGSVYFIPHWIVLFMLVFGETFKGKRKPRVNAEVKTTVAVERVATNGDAPVESKKEQWRTSRRSRFCLSNIFFHLHGSHFGQSDHRILRHIIRFDPTGSPKVASRASSHLAPTTRPNACSASMSLVTSLNPRAPSAVHPTGSVEGPEAGIENNPEPPALGAEAASFRRFADPTGQFRARA